MSDLANELVLLLRLSMDRNYLFFLKRLAFVKLVTVASVWFVAKLWCDRVFQGKFAK